jgi:hypothetical protein
MMMIYVQYVLKILHVTYREGAVTAVQKPDPVAQTAAIPKVIIRAEPTLARILKTLDADYLKIQVQYFYKNLCNNI